MLQEVKSLNTRLIAFMKQHEQVEALITLIVKQPSGGSDSEGSSPRNQQPVPLQQQLIRPRKMPRTACEVGTSTGVTLVPCHCLSEVSGSARICCCCTL